MLSADALLVYEFVDTMAIPAKCFEDLAARKPILGCVNDDSAAVWLLRQNRAARIVGRAEIERCVGSSSPPFGAATHL